jgi:CHAT domain-containing protein
MPRRSSSARITAALLSLVCVAGCASDSMSLEEAKKTTVTVSEVPGFVPPPRRIDDITAILEQPGVFDSKITSNLRAQADAVAPPNADAQFYSQRGEAARQLGRLTALEDLREAQRLSEASGKRNPQIMRRLAVAEREMGNFSIALQLLEEVLKIHKREVSTYGRLVEIYVQIGELERARRIADDLKSICGLPGKKRKEQARLWCNLELLAAESTLLGAEARYQEAEGLLRQQLQQARAVKHTHPVRCVSVRVDLAENLLRQERFLDAEIEVREALREALGLAGKDSTLTARVINRMVDTLRAQGRLAEAEKLGQLNVQTLGASGIASDSIILARAHMQLGSVLAARRNFTEAVGHFDLAVKGMAQDQFPYRRALLGNPNFVLSLLMTGRYQQAMKIATNSYEKAARKLGEKHYLTAEKLAFRAMGHYRLNHLKAAAEDFAKATDTLLESPIFKADYSRAQRLRTILDDYLSLLDRIRGTPLEKGLGMDAAGMAFQIAEASQAHSVQAAVAASSARLAEADPELRDLIRREQDARKSVEVLESTMIDLLAAPEREQQPAVIRELQTKIGSLSKAGATLQDEITRRFPKYADFVNPRAVTWTVAQQNLRPREALLVIHTTEDKSYVWAVPRQGGLRFHSTGLGRDELSRLVGDLRRSLDAHPRNFADIPAFDVNQSFEIYSRLLKPVEADWKEATDLLIVAHGPLGQLPLSLLVTSPGQVDTQEDVLFARYRKIPWLIRKASVTILPSVGSLVMLRSLPEGDLKRRAFVGFADPIFDPRQLTGGGSGQGPQQRGVGMEVASRGAELHIRGIRTTEQGSLDNQRVGSSRLAQLNRLPDTADEVNAVALALGADLKQDVFLGKDASERRIKTMGLADRKVISFATHALLPGDLDGLEQPALALSSPTVTGDNEDGLLTMGEVLKLKLNADWVVLSACNTGAAAGQGAEALSGLGRAFFYAGTRSLLVSMWPVETTSAKKLVTETFRLQKDDKTLARHRALQKSMLALIDEASLKDEATGRIVASYAHPLFWAPFVVVGNP